jgi:predicted permease
MKRILIGAWAKLANLIFRGRAERELGREIDAHLTLLQDDFERRGLSPEEAAVAARRAYGGVEQAKELHREARSFVWIDLFFRDVVYGGRNLMRHPGFTLVAVIALALGIGVNATVFGVYNAVALKQLPLADPSRVVRIERWFEHGGSDYKFAYPEYESLRDHTTVFSGVAAASSSIPVLAATERLSGYAVSANYFTDLGVNARIGRTFLPGEDGLAGANAVAVLSYRFWQRRFHMDPEAIGQTIRLNGLAYTIIGVAPLEFIGTDVSPTEVSFWAPLSMLEQLDPSFGARDITHPGFQLLARMKKGVSAAQAQAETDLLIRGYLAGFRQDNRTTAITLQRPSYFGVAGEFWLKALAVIVLLTVSLVLVVACANVANMLQARGVARQREIGIRLAMGASRARVVRQLLTESILLSLLGGTAGVLLSGWSARLLWVSVNAFLQGTFRMAELNTSPDAHVFVYGLVLSALTGICFGLVPALQSTRADLYNGMKQQRSRLRGVLLGAQVAVSVLLLVVSGGLLRSLVGSFVKASSLGFEAHDNFRLLVNTGDEDTVLRLRKRLETLPEVSSVARGIAPLEGAFAIPMAAGKWSGQGVFSFASDGFFETLEIPLIRGRGFTRQEAYGGAPVAVISESAARRCWPAEDPVGRRFSLNLPFQGASTLEVIGVAKDVRFESLTEIDPLHVYLPNRVGPFPRVFGGLVFRIHGNRDRALAAVQNAVESVDPSLLRSLDMVSLEDGPVAVQRGIYRVLGAFAGVLTLMSLAMAGVGIYGVMAFLVSQRTREIGIRIALGATARTLLNSVVIQGLRPVFVGSLLGFALATVVTAAIRAKGALPPGMASNAFGDPALYGELAVVVAIAVIASAIPARRALRVDPTVALRYE